MARNPIALAAVLVLALAGCIAPQEDAPAEDREPAPTPAPTSSADVCTPPDLEASAGPGGQASVANYPGSFSYSGRTTAQTGREVYLWQNPSGGAMVSWGGQAATGDLAVSIQDACGKEVYTSNVGMMSQGGASETTQRGEAGDWYIVLDFTLFTGQMGLNVNSA